MPTDEEVEASLAAARGESAGWTSAAQSSYSNRPRQKRSEDDKIVNTWTPVLSTFHFYVQINDITEAVFTQVDGLEITTESQEVKEGGLNDRVHHLLGRTNVGNITLRNGITVSHELWDWYTKVIQGHEVWKSVKGGYRKHVSIVVVDQTGREVKRWDFAMAVPIKWVGPQFNAGQSSVAVQALTLTHEGLILR